MKKKLALTAAAVALVGTLAVGGTLAWFTDTEEATNVVTIGNVDVVWNENDQRITSNNKNDFGNNKVPGDSYVKNAKVENVGKNSAYVRAKIQYVAGNETLDTLPSYYNVEILAGKTDDITGKTNEWVKDGEYYYFMSAVEPNQFTDLLVGTVSIPTDATQGQIANDTFKVVLYAEAIQSENVIKNGEKISNPSIDQLKEVFKKTIENGYNGETGN